MINHKDITNTTNALQMYYDIITFKQNYMGMLIVFLHGKPLKAKNAHQNPQQISQVMLNWVTIALRFSQNSWPCTDSFEHFKAVMVLHDLSKNHYYHPFQFSFIKFASISLKLTLHLLTESTFMMRFSI